MSILYIPNLTQYINLTTIHLHLSDAFIQSDLQYIQAIYIFVFSVCVFPGNRTHNLCAAKSLSRQM